MLCRQNSKRVAEADCSWWDEVDVGLGWQGQGLVVTQGPGSEFVKRSFEFWSCYFVREWRRGIFRRLLMRFVDAKRVDLPGFAKRRLGRGTLKFRWFKTKRIPAKPILKHLVCFVQAGADLGAKRANMVTNPSWLQTQKTVKKTPKHSARRENAEHNPTQPWRSQCRAPNSSLTWAAPEQKTVWKLSRNSLTATKPRRTRGLKTLNTCLCELTSLSRVWPHPFVDEDSLPSRHCLP